MNAQTIEGLTHGPPCSEHITVGKAPAYRYPLVGNPDLHAGGREDAFLALQYEKDAAGKVASSVIMSVYNAAPALQRSLPPLFALTTGSWELIIVLDACYDSSYEAAADLVADHFRSSSCARVRIYVQPTAVWEVSSDNIGLRMSDASDFFVIVQPDIIFHEENWNIRMLQHLLESPAVFSISGRCAHSFNGTSKVGRCSADHADKLSASQLLENKLYIMETGNRGPLMLRAAVTRQLGFLDEVAHLLDDDDHDLNMRAGKLGYVSSYLPIGAYTPQDLSPKRNADFRKWTPQEVIEEEAKYKQFRQELANTRRKEYGL